MALTDALNSYLRYSHMDADILRKQLATDPEHLKAGSNLRVIAADAHQEAGDGEFADYLRSSFPLAVDGKKVLRSSLRLHRLLTTLHTRHHRFLTSDPYPAPERRLNDPVNDETVKELEHLGRDHEANILRSENPFTYRNGRVMGDYPEFAWPGGNHIVYNTLDGGMICPKCRNGANGCEAIYTPQHDPQWQVTGISLHDEGPPIHCDHCNFPMAATYGDPDEPEEGDE